MDVWVISVLPLWFWVTALVVCLILAPYHAFHKQQAKHDKKLSQLRDKEKALRNYHRLFRWGNRVMKELHANANGGTSRSWSSFTDEHLKPWVSGLQEFALGTRWENTGLGDGITDHSPEMNYDSIMAYIQDKQNWLEAVHDKYNIKDEYDPLGG